MRRLPKPCYAQGKPDERMKLGAEQLPRLRRELVSFERGPIGQWMRKYDYDRTLRPIRNFYSERQWAANNLDALMKMDLFHVTEDMTKLCVAAAESLGPIETLGIADFPTRTGLIFWSGDPVFVDHLEKYDEDREACAVRWVMADDDRGMLVWWLEDRDGGTIPKALSRETVRQTNPRLVEFVSASIIEFGTAPDGPVDFPFRDRLLVATCLLMAQHISQTMTPHLPRADARADRRLNIEPKPVTIIALRRVHNEGSDHIEGDGRDYSHRWIVGGHWRNHWYPKREVHRPVWIAPYVKGPDDKPLVLKERVTSLMR
jgi:hypothetical protein